MYMYVKKQKGKVERETNGHGPSLLFLKPLSKKLTICGDFHAIFYTKNFRESFFACLLLIMSYDNVITLGACIMIS